MQFKLRNFVLAAAAVAAIATTGAMAETTLKVPFSFTAAGKTCPAGTYIVERSTVGTIVTLKSMDAPRTFSWMVTPGDPQPTDRRVILNFDQVGQDHVLHSVQYGPMVTSTLDKNLDRLERRPMRIVGGQ